MVTRVAFLVLTSRGDLWFLSIIRSTSLSPSLEGCLRTSGRFSTSILRVVTPVLSFTLLNYFVSVFLQNALGLCKAFYRMGNLYGCYALPYKSIYKWFHYLLRQGSPSLVRGLVMSSGLHLWGFIKAAMSSLCFLVSNSCLASSQWGKSVFRFNVLNRCWPSCWGIAF